MINAQGIQVPPIMYGTAWKENRTAELTSLALSTGFRAIDTANQRKHYVETAVGQALAASGLPRGDVFVQTKFTYPRGQDHRIPYDPRAPWPQAVRQSLASSKAHLGLQIIDAYLLHGPWASGGWHDIDREVWTTMEALHREGTVRLLGVSNISAAALRSLCAEATILPAFVQNRCYASTGWDREVRAVCRTHGIVYQAFSLLTANQRELAAPRVSQIAARVGLTIEGLAFRFAAALGMLPLTGTSSATHMRADLDALAIPLPDADVQALESLAG